jgi:hypothetical protein
VNVEVIRQKLPGVVGSFYCVFVDGVFLATAHPNAWPGIGYALSYRGQKFTVRTPRGIPGAVRKLIESGVIRP